MGGQFVVTREALRETFDRLNAELFEGQLASIPLELSGAAKRGGTYRAKAEYVQPNPRMRRLTRDFRIRNVRDESISISRKLCPSQDVLDRFMAHEMIHQWQTAVLGISEDKGGHGEAFRRKMEEINTAKGPGFVTVTSDVSAGDLGGKEGQVYHVVIFERGGRRFGGFYRRSLGEGEREAVEQMAQRMGASYRILATTSHDAQALLDMSRMKPGARSRTWPCISADLYESIVGGEVVTAALCAARLRLADLSGVTLYHGTGLQEAAEIARSGIRSFSGDRWSGNPNIANAGVDSIYLTPSFELALRYAQGMSGDRVPVVFECRIAGRHMKKLRTDPMDTWEDAWDDDGWSDSRPQHAEALSELGRDARGFLSDAGVRGAYSMAWPDDSDECDGLNLYKLALRILRKSAPEASRAVFRRFREKFSPGDHGYFHIRKDGTIRLDSSYWNEAHQVQYAPRRREDARSPTILPPAVIKSVWVPAPLADASGAADRRRIAPVKLPSESKMEFDEVRGAYESVGEWCDELSEAKSAEDIEQIHVDHLYVDEIGDDSPEPLLAIRELARSIAESPHEDHTRDIEALRDEFAYGPDDAWGQETYGESIEMAKISLDALRRMHAEHVIAAARGDEGGIDSALRAAALEVAASSGTIVAYHATLSGSDILRNGFRKSDEVGRVGLGGSSMGGSVSFTTDWGVAKGIHKSFVMMHSLVNAADPLAAMREHLASLDPGTAETVLEYWKSADGGDLRELLDGWKPRPTWIGKPASHRMQTYDQLVQQGFKPVHAAGDEGGEGGTLYYHWLEPVTSEDAERMVYTYVKVYFYANKDEYNPVFMGGDSSHFKGIPRDDIGIFTVELSIDPSKKRKNHGDLYLGPGYAILPAESEYRISDLSMISVILDYDPQPGTAPPVQSEERSYHTDPEVEAAVNALMGLLSRHRPLLERAGLDVRQALAELRNMDDMSGVARVAGAILRTTGLRGAEATLRSIVRLRRLLEPSETAKAAIGALPAPVREEVSGAPPTAKFLDIIDRWHDRDEAAYLAWVSALGGLDIRESEAEREIDDWIQDRQSGRSERLAEEVRWAERDIPSFSVADVEAYLELAERLANPAGKSAALKVALRTVFDAGDPASFRHFILRRGRLWLWSDDIGGDDERRLVESVRDEFGTDKPPFDQSFPVNSKWRVRDMFEPSALFGSPTDEDLTRFRQFASDTIHGSVFGGKVRKAETVGGLPIHVNHPELKKLLRHLGAEAEGGLQPSGMWFHGFSATPERMAGVAKFGLRPGGSVGESNWKGNIEYDRSLVYLTTNEATAKGHACQRERDPYAIVVAVRESDLDPTRMEADFDAERGGFRPNRAGLAGYRGRIPAALFAWVKVFRGGYNLETTPLLLTLGSDEFGALAKEYAEWAERTKADREALEKEQRFGPSFTDRRRVQELMDRIGRDPIGTAAAAAKAEVLRAARLRIRETSHG